MMLLQGTPDAQIFAILLVLVSPAVGSFLGVLVDRLPRDESVIWPRSACRSCDTPLTFAHLWPILSYVRQRGRCHHCAEAIPPITLYIEISALGLAILAGLLATSPVELLLITLVFWSLLALGVTDLIWFRLPDPLTASLFILALALAILGLGQVDVFHALTGGIAGAGSFWLIRILYFQVRGVEGLGLGDVKLMAGLGTLHGVILLPEVVLIAALTGLAWGVVQARRSREVVSARTRIPFGAFLCLASAIVWIAHAV